MRAENHGMAKPDGFDNIALTRSIGPIYGNGFKHLQFVIREDIACKFPCIRRFNVRCPEIQHNLILDGEKVAYPDF
jgi:hypothetical protein